MKVVAIVGSYRKGGIIDSAVDEILAAAAQKGAEIAKIYLIDRHVEFCTNCRACTQEAGSQRGKCVMSDEMDDIITELERADAFILGSPMNFWTVTAVMKRFIERLVCFAYWPWGAAGPKYRIRGGKKRAVVVGSSAAPAIISRLFTKMVKLLKNVSILLGAGKVDVLFIGLAAGKERQDLSRRVKRKARILGKKLVAG